MTETSIVDGSPRLVAYDSTTLAHRDAVEVGPSIPSSAGIRKRSHQPLLDQPADLEELGRKALRCVEMKDPFLPGVPSDLVLARYRAAPGNEIASGKLGSPESSAALVANTFGFFLGRPSDLPPLPVDLSSDWPPTGVQIEEKLRFPWKGGEHPWLDAVVETPTMLIGIESKRYESFRRRKAAVFSDAYSRPVWGERMTRYETLRDGLPRGEIEFERLDAPQLCKHAFGLRSSVHRPGDRLGKTPVLVYLYAEPDHWPTGRRISPEDLALHRSEIARFSEIVEGDEVIFRSFSYQQLLKTWGMSPVADVRSHAEAIFDRFQPL